MNIQELVDNFEVLDDWEERYRYLIDLGARLPRLEENLKTEENKVRGCMSQVWMQLEWDAQGRLVFQAESDAQIVQGLIAVLSLLFSGRTRAEIAAADVEGFFAGLGLDQHLSPNRRNGFFAMVETVKSFAGRG